MPESTRTLTETVKFISRNRKMRGGGHLPPLLQERLDMKYMITAAMLAGLLLCGCEGETDSSPLSDSTAAVTATVSEDASGTTDAETETAPDKETPPMNTTEAAAQSETTAASAAAEKADITVSGASGSVVTEKLPAQERTAASAKTDPDRRTTAATAASATDPDADGGSILPDDGLDWSPLVPVD